MINLDEALEELQLKTYRQIQEETAWKWAGRACASYQNCLQEVPANRLICWTLGEEYYHEAVEHAALAEETSDLMQAIRDTVHPFQEKAALSMGANPETADLV